MSFWCLTTMFNPAGYQSLTDNYNTFAASLRRQGVNLLTLELAFGDDPHRLSGEGVVQLRGNSVMWHKERLLNYGRSILPADCTAYAWLDADLVFEDDQWAEKTEALLKDYDVIQLFNRVFHLPKGDIRYNGRQKHQFASIAWQASKYPNWLQRRADKYISFGAPGFAWAARRETFDHCNGIYDRDVVGSGDCLFTDCLLGSWQLHGFHRKFNDKCKADVTRWSDILKQKNLSVGCLPINVFHLWHGDIRNRGYMRRHKILTDHDYDPERDIALVNNVWEWATDKPQMHAEVKDYFFQRQEDSEFKSPS